MQNLLDWGRRVLSEHFRSPPSRMHVAMADELARFGEQRGMRLNILGPRGGAKSTVCTLAYVLQVACEQREPYIWIVSDTCQQALIHLENVKDELLRNETIEIEYEEAFGRGPRWKNNAIEMKNGVMIEAYSTNQRVRGRRRGAHRPTLIVCDDLQNDRHITSAREREKSTRWFHSALMNVGTPETNIINLATALHREALAIQLLAKPTWQSRVFRAIETWPTRTELWEEWEQLLFAEPIHEGVARARVFYETHRAEMDEGAQVLWPEVEDLYYLMILRAEGGRTAFEREKQNSPVDPEGCEFARYLEGDIWFDAWGDGITLRAMALDPSQGASEVGDFSAFVLLGAGTDGLFYVEADIARRDATDQVAAGVALHERFYPQYFGVEANSWQQLLGRYFDEEFHRIGKSTAFVSLIHNKENKVVRIRRLGSYLAKRKLRFLQRSAGTKLLVEQLRDFPLGAYDDGPDALEMAMRLVETAQNGPAPIERASGNILTGHCTL